MTMTGLLGESLNMRYNLFFGASTLKNTEKFVCFRVDMTDKCMHALVGLLSCKQIVVLKSVHSTVSASPLVET